MCASYNHMQTYVCMVEIKGVDFLYFSLKLDKQFESPTTLLARCYFLNGSESPETHVFFRPFFIYLNLVDISVIITWVTWSSNGPTDITRPGSGLQLLRPGIFYVLTIIDLYIFIFT